MIVLDTDHTTLLQQEAANEGRSLRERLRTCDDRDICLTVISLEEQLRGWLAALRRHQAPERQMLYYDRLIELNRFFARWRILRFDEAATDMFRQLRRRRLKVGTQDLKVAAICLARDATLLSGNLRDFQKVAGLRVEDWVHA